MKLIWITKILAPILSYTPKNIDVQDHARKINQKIERVHKANEQKVWKPQTIVFYPWSYQVGDFLAGSTVKIEYYEDTGYIKSEMDATSRMDYVYDANGQVIERYEYSIENGEATLEAKLEVQYDEIVTDFYIDEEYFMYMGETPILVFGFKRPITRNEDGNITRIQFQTCSFGSDWEDHGSDIVIEYGSDGKATTIYEMDYDNYSEELFETKYLENIEWYSTDGQITTTNWDSEKFFMGANRIKSADVRMHHLNGTCHLTAVYPEPNAVESETILGEERVHSFEFVELDENGSFQKDWYYPYFILNNDVWEHAGFTRSYLSRTFDEYAIEVYSDDATWENGVFSDELETKIEVTYDPDYGYPTEGLYTLAYDGGEYMIRGRYEYKDYILVGSDVQTIISPNDEAPVEYFTLQGVKVTTPQNGIFIRRQGAEAKKVIR